MNRTTLQVLQLLKRGGGPSSGRVICETLKIPRQILWKRINQLRDMGYRILTVAHQGYRLDGVPNVPLELEVVPLLKTQRFGRNYHFLPKATSTNQVAAELAYEGAAEGTTVVADAQTEGRGRLARTWFSPPGANLYVSVVLRPAVDAVKKPQIGLVAVIALVEALVRLYPRLPVGVKWPNDVCIENRKLAGVLCNLKGKRRQSDCLVLGVGVNVNLVAAKFPAEIAHCATSLREAVGEEISRPRLLATFLEELEEAYDRWLDGGFEPFLEIWAKYAILTGSQVRIAAQAGDFEGTVTGITADGALALRLSDGTVSNIVAGEVMLIDR